MPAATPPAPVVSACWPRRLRTTVCAVGLIGLIGTLAPMLGGMQTPAWLAPAVADAVARPLRADLPDTIFARLRAGYVDEIRFAARGFARALQAAHRHPDRWLATPLFLVLAIAPWSGRLPIRLRWGTRALVGSPGAAGVDGSLPPGGPPGGRAARGALLALVPLQLLFHGTSIQPLLGAWVDLLGNLTRTLLIIQIEAYSFFVPGATRAVALFFAQESPHLEAQLQRQLWLLRGSDLLLAGLEAVLLLWLARAVRNTAAAAPAPAAPDPAAPASAASSPRGPARPAA